MSGSKPTAITPQHKAQLKAYASLLFVPGTHYSKGEILEQLCRHTAGDIERAQNGFFLLVKSKAIASIYSGKYYLNK